MSLFKIRIGSHGLVLLPSDASHVLRQLFQHRTHPAPEELYVCQETATPGLRYSECVLLRPDTAKVFRLEVKGVDSTASTTTTTGCATNQPTNLATCHDALIGSVVKRSKIPAGLDDSAIVVLPAPAHRAPPADSSKPTLSRIDTVHAMCPDSMRWLDGVHRAYVARHKFAGRSLAFKAVAGSGKTTILLQLAKQFQEERKGHPEWSSKRVGYVAFNKQLVDEFRVKCTRKGLIQVVTPFTFDGLVHRVARDRHKAKYGDSVPFDFHGALNPRLLAEQYSWFRGKAHRLKKCYIDRFAKFCQDPNQLEPTDKWVKQLWEDTRRGRLVTFDGLRKLAYTEHWLRGYMDTTYARVFVDEAQDLDPIMLSILNKDVQAPKVFVGDPHQQIYEWRGTVNAFEHLPERTLQMHLYKTFRMGEPATSEVSRITGIPMISGIPDTKTSLTTGMTHMRSKTALAQPGPTSYTYVHRTWKSLLPAAQELAKQMDSSQRLWIVDYQSQMKQVLALHERIQQYGSCGDAAQPDSDDLPAFLTKLSAAELAALRQTIESRLTHDPSKATCRMYTIHRFKGLEDGIVRVASDLDRQNDANLAYVAFTRAQEQLWVDVGMSTAPLDEMRLQSAASASVPDRSRNKRAPFQPGSAQTPFEIASVKTILSPSATKPATTNLCTREGAPICVHEELQTFRRNTAKARGVPAFCVFGNQTLEELERLLPTSRSELLQVHGIGKKKMADYGEAILDICARHAGQTPPKRMKSDVHAPSNPASSGATDQGSAQTPPQSPPSPDTPPGHTPIDKRRAPAPRSCPPPAANGDLRAFFTAKKEDCTASSPPTPPPTPPQPSATPSEQTMGAKETPENESKLLLCYDIETTGFRPNVANIIQISVQFLKCDLLHTSAERTAEHAVPTLTTLDTYTSFVQPGTPIPSRIVDYTGISDDDVREAPVFAAIHETIQQKVHTLCRTHNIRTCVWIAHNGIQFDHKFLRHNIGMLESPSLVETDAVPGHVDVTFEFADTLPVAKQCWKDLDDGPPKYKLDLLYEWCTSRCADASAGEEDDAIRFHRADDDVKAMVVVMRALAEEPLARRELFGYE